MKHYSSQYGLLFSDIIGLICKIAYDIHIPLYPFLKGPDAFMGRRCCNNDGLARRDRKWKSQKEGSQKTYLEGDEL